MAPAIRDGNQGDLLSWQAPEPVERFDAGRVRAATTAGQISRLVSEALKKAAEDGVARADVAASMSAFLGQEVTTNILNAYASEAREEHIINMVRFVALLHATRDPRLLQGIAELFGWAVVDRKYLPVIELASLREHEDAVRKRRQALQSQARAAGAL